MSSDGLLRHIAKELGEMRREYQRNGRAFPLRLESLRLLADSAGHGGTELSSIPDSDDARLVYKYEDVAKRLSVSPKTVQRLVASGLLPVVMIGSSPRVTREDLDAFVATLDRRRGLHEQEEVQAS